MIVWVTHVKVGRSQAFYFKKTEIFLVIVSVFFCYGFMDLTHSTYFVQLLNTVPNVAVDRL